MFQSPQQRIAQKMSERDSKFNRDFAANKIAAAPDPRWVGMTKVAMAAAGGMAGGMAGASMGASLGSSITGSGGGGGNMMSNLLFMKAMGGFGGGGGGGGFGFSPAPSGTVLGSDISGMPMSYAPNSAGAYAAQNTYFSNYR